MAQLIDTTVFGDLTVTGSLAIQGTTTTVDTTNLAITDNIVVLNNGETGVGITLGSAGVEIERGTLTNATFLFNESDDTFKTNFGLDVTGALQTSGAIGITSGNLQIGEYGSTNTGSLVLTGNTIDKQSIIKCTNGNLYLDSNSGSDLYLNYYTGGSLIYFGTGASGTIASISAGGTFSPTTDSTGGIGDASHAWLNVYTQNIYGTDVNVSTNLKFSTNHTIANTNSSTLDWTSNATSIRMDLITSGGHVGSIYGDGTGNIGFLDDGGSWAVQVQNDTHVKLFVTDVARIEANTTGVVLTGTTYVGAQATYAMFNKGGMVFRDYVNGNLTNGRMYFLDDAWYFRGGGEGDADLVTDTTLYVRDGGANKAVSLSDHVHSDYISSTVNDYVNAITTWNDSKEVRLGSGGDLRLYHNATDSFIVNDTGDLAIYCTEISQYVSLRATNSSSALKTGITVGGAATSVYLYHEENEKLVTSSTGVSVTGTIASDGIKFPATQVPSADVNTLDDYEEGTWTPGLYDGSLLLDKEQTYYSQNGKYTKIGNVVYISGSVNVNSLGTMITGNSVFIGPLPFTSQSNNGDQGVINFGFGASLNIPVNATIIGTTSATSITVRMFDLVTGTSNMIISEVSISGRLDFSGFYFVA